MLLTLTACGTAPEEADISLDSDRGFIHYGGMEEVCATEDTVYFTSGQLVHYYEKATGISGVLCGKAECEHSTAYGSSCNAYINSISDDLCLYNGRLYWRNYDTIYSMALDGTDHRTERQMENDVYSNHTGGSLAIFHRGYAYVWVKNYTVKDGQEDASLDLAAVPLDPDGEIRMIFSDELDDYASGRSCFVTMQAYGDNLYILTNYAVNGGEGDVNASLELNDFRIRRYNAAARELTTLYHDSQSPIDYTVEMWAMDDGIVFFGYDRLGGAGSRFFQFDFETGEITRLFGYDYGNVQIAEDLVVSSRYTCEKSNPTNPWGLTLAPQDIEMTGELYVVMQNFAGDVLVDDSYPLTGRYGAPYFQGMDDTYAYFFSSTSFNGTTYMSLIGVALDGSGMEVLCTEEEFYDYGTGGHSTMTITEDDGTTITVEDKKITIIPGDGGETVTMTVEELIEKGYQP